MRWAVEVERVVGLDGYGSGVEPNLANGALAARPPSLIRMCMYDASADKSVGMTPMERGVRGFLEDNTVL